MSRLDELEKNHPWASHEAVDRDIAWLVELVKEAQEILAVVYSGYSATAHGHPEESKDFTPEIGMLTCRDWFTKARE